MSTFINQDYDCEGNMYYGGKAQVGVKVLAFSAGQPSAPDRYVTEMGVSLGGLKQKSNKVYEDLRKLAVFSVIVPRERGYYKSLYLDSFEMMFSEKRPGSTGVGYAEWHFYNALIFDIKPVDARKMNSKPPYPRLDELSVAFGGIKWT